MHQIGARLGGGGGFQLQPEKLDRLFHHLNQLGAAIRLFFGFRIARRHLQTRLLREDFHRLHKADVFRVFDKGNSVTFGVAAKAIVVPFAVIYMKRRRFFLMKWARRPPVAFALVGFFGVPHDLSADDLRQRNPSA